MEIKDFIYFGITPYALLSLFFIYRLCEYILRSPENWSSYVGNKLHIGESLWSAGGLGIHFYGGIIMIFLNLFITWPYWRQESTIYLHRTLGKIYLIAGLMTGIGGQIHILSDGTVGGFPMDLAFFVYGLMIEIFSVLTYYYIKTNDVKNHRESALRLWALAAAGIFYRVLYFILLFFGYPVSGTHFDHPIDRIVNWAFFLVPLFLVNIYLSL